MKSSLAAAVLLCVPVLSSAEVGIGGSLRAGEAGIYVPIDIGNSLRIEPYADVSKRKFESGVFGSSSDQRRFGLGAFGRSSVTDAIRLVAGARLAYVRASGSAVNEDGFAIEPTVGAEYLFTPRVSLGLEEFYYYQHLTGTDPAGSVKDTEQGTGSRIILRFMF